ncbi:MAG: hypothetical protein HQL49_00360 [Gammaproteobacteria bacterium]|nr:hypothetical protein [Gammaproteobacteria bacterium]
MLANILLFTPPAQAPLPPTGEIITTLQAIDFIGEPYPDRIGIDYQPGTALMQHLTFLGCSPALALGAPGINGDAYCHIELLGPLATPRFIFGENLKPIACPHCRERLSATLIKNSVDNLATLTCPHCQQRAPAATINWRKSAGCSRLFIKVWGIFDSEAIPNDSLLTPLGQLTDNIAWSYFYYRGHPF